jgi:HNH endonuclease
MPECLLCLSEKPSLTDEHIIPAALGSALTLPRSTCEECQRLCNRSFEQRFLKGSNFVSLLRANLGIKGRRNEPIYGFDRHGNSLTMVVQQGFPPIKIGIGANQIVRPMQVIMANADHIHEPLRYDFCPDLIERPITNDFFENVVETVPEDADCAAFWADGDVLPVNYWRELFEAFVSWCNSKNLAAMASVASTQNSGVELAIDWNTEYRNRGLTKICFMYAMARMQPEHRRSDSFRFSRRYILRGITYPLSLWPSAPIVQWNGPYPGQEVLGDKLFTYLLATVNLDTGLYSLIRLHNMGLFAMKLAEPEHELLCPDTLTTYLLRKNGSERYVLSEDLASPEDAAAYARSVKSAQEL